MNVLTIMSDEHSYQMMNFINHSILETPNLDRLAKESVVFDNCYTPSPLCVPARGAFITGKYVNRIGTWDNAAPYDGSILGLPQHLKNNNKRFICIGKTHFHPDGDFGFEYEENVQYCDTIDPGAYFRNRKEGHAGHEKRFDDIFFRSEDKYDDNVLKSGLKWLNEHGHEDNWNLYIGFLDPHFPFHVKKENWDKFDSLITEVPKELKSPFTSYNEALSCLRTYFKCDMATDEQIRKMLVGYHAAIYELDERVGQLLSKIDELGLRDNTVVIYTSDHGEALGYHGMWYKCNMFERSSHIPLIVRVPGVEPKRINSNVNLTDVFPTTCDYMEIPTPDGLDGYSLKKLIETGTDEERPDFTFSEYQAHGTPNGMFMIRWKQYKYVYYCYDRPQLFDLEWDPDENYSLLSNDVRESKYWQIAEECHKRLLSVCNPYEVDARAKEFQERIRNNYGINDYNINPKDYPVPHIEPII